MAYLDGANTGECPEVPVTNPRVLGLDFLEETTSDVQAIVGSVKCLGLETHRCIVAVKHIISQSKPFTSLLLTFRQSLTPYRKSQKHATLGERGLVRKSHLRIRI